jgi:hypothetical protein
MERTSEKLTASPLVSVISKDSGADDGIESRINKARHALNIPRPLWKSSALSLQNKIRID